MNLQISHRSVKGLDQQRERLRSLVLVFIKRLDINTMWASLLHLRAITLEVLGRMEELRSKPEQVLSLIKYIEEGLPERLYLFLQACHLTGHEEILDLFDIPESTYKGARAKLDVAQIEQDEEIIYEAFAETVKVEEKTTGEDWQTGMVQSYQVGDGRSSVKCLCWTSTNTLLVSCVEERKVWKLNLKETGIPEKQVCDEFSGMWVSSISHCWTYGTLAVVAWNESCVYMQNYGTTDLEKWNPPDVTKPDQVSLGHHALIAVLPAHSRTIFAYGRLKKQLLIAKNINWEGVGEELSPGCLPELVRFTITKEQRFMATTTDHRLVMTSLDDSWIIPVGGRGHSNGKLYSPTSVCAVPGELVYVANMNPGRVSIFSQYSGWYVCDVHIELGESQSVSMDIIFSNMQLEPRMAIGLEYGVIKVCSLYKSRDNQGIDIKDASEKAKSKAKKNWFGKQKQKK